MRKLHREKLGAHPQLALIFPLEWTPSTQCLSLGMFRCFSVHKLQPPRTPKTQGRAEPGAAVCELRTQQLCRACTGLSWLCWQLHRLPLSCCSHALLLPQDRVMTVARKRHLCCCNRGDQAQGPSDCTQSGCASSLGNH